MTIPNAIIHIQRSHSDRKFLILGKGPSFQCLDEIDSSEYVSIGINHVCEAKKVNYAHIIDIEVLDHIGEKIYENAQYLIIPFVPHERSKIKINGKIIFWPSRMTLIEWVERIPLLNKLYKEGRLLSYDLSSVNYIKYAPELRVEVQTFSAATIVSLLATAKIKRIYFLGIDGGNLYDSAFDKYSSQTKLQTGQENYNIQFKEIAALRFKYNLEINHLKRNKVNIIISHDDELASLVQKYILSRMASNTVAFNDGFLENCCNVYINDVFLPLEDMSLLVSPVNESISIKSGNTVYDYLNSYALRDFFLLHLPVLNYLQSIGKIHLIEEAVMKKFLRTSILHQISEGKKLALSQLSTRTVISEDNLRGISTYLRLVLERALYPIISNNKLIFDILINKNYAYFNSLIIYSAIRKRLITYGKI